MSAARRTSATLHLSVFPAPPVCPAAGTQAGEEIPIVSRSNIKEFRDSFSNENFDFRNSPNITFFVYVSNFTWPIKIQVCVPFNYRWPLRPLGRCTCDGDGGAWS